MAALSVERHPWLSHKAITTPCPRKAGKPGSRYGQGRPGVRTGPSCTPAFPARAPAGKRPSQTDESRCPGHRAQGGTRTGPMRSAMDTGHPARRGANCPRTRKNSKRLEMRTIIGGPADSRSAHRPEGRVLEWILDACRVNGSVYTGNARNPLPVPGPPGFSATGCWTWCCARDLDIYIRLLRSRAGPTGSVQCGGVNTEAKTC